MIELVQPENDKVLIGIPTERVLFPEFVENRDNIVAKLAGRCIGISAMKGHRVDRNRDQIVQDFLSHPDKPDWLLFLDSDMLFPTDIGMRLMALRLPVVGGLYFHRSNHLPFVMTEFDYQPDQYGRMRRTWLFERQLVYDFLDKEARLPMHDGAVAIDGAKGRIIPCDAVGTGCMMIHRSVLEALEPPWFEYREMAESEDLTFCYRVKHELDVQVYADLGSVCGHFFNVPQGHKQFREAHRLRGVQASGYSLPQAASWLASFAGYASKEQAMQALLSYNQDELSRLWNERGDIGDIDFYNLASVGEQYLLDLLHWNRTSTFATFRNGLMGIEDKKVVVIGSGIGTLAIQLAIQRCGVHAYEVNSTLRNFARRRWEWTRENRVHSPIGDVKWKGSFKPGKRYGADMINSVDLVVAIDVFEHMPEKDLRGVFKLLQTMVKKGGRVYCHNNWGQQDLYPMHHNHSESWQEIIETHGFFQLDDLWLVKVHPMMDRSGGDND